MNEEEQLAILRLSAVPGIGSLKLRTLVNCFGSAQNVLNQSKQALMRIPGIDKKCAHALVSFDSVDFAEQQLAALHTCNGWLLTIWHDDYPRDLKEIYDPPALLFIRGNLKPEDRLALGVVGMRQPSIYGKVATEQIVSALVRQNLTIISGLAYGVDTVAHTTALKAGGRTVAVLGSGVDNIYPANNQRLAQAIVENGAVISEFPMGSIPDRNNFPRRNRIISGMSLGVVVIEAGKKSGSLLTADFAVEQNREVFAVPGNINSPKSIGPNSLIKQGAVVVTHPDDILSEIAPRLASPRSSDGMAADSIPDLCIEERDVLKLLQHEARHIDWIARSVRQPTSKVLATLLTLELKGLVRQDTGKMFLRI